MTIMRNWLVDALLQPHEYDCNKHELALDCEQFAVDQVNAMSRMELLYVIGEALRGIRSDAQSAAASLTPDRRA